MNDSTDHGIEAVEQWGHRRDNVRNATHVPGVLTEWSGARIDCTLTDVSSNGAALAVDPKNISAVWEDIHPGASATLEFVLDPDKPSARCVTSAVVIMRRDPHSIGIRFTRPEELQAELRELAVAAALGRSTEVQRRARELEPVRRRILRGLRKKMDDHLPNLIWVLLTEVGKRLNALSRSSRGKESAAAQADASRLEARSIPIGRNIEVTIIQSFAETCDLDQTQELSLMLVRAASTGEPLGSAEASSEKSSTTGRDAYLAALCEAAEASFRTEYGRLSARLSEIVGHALDQHTDPLQPAALCRICWRAVVDQVDTPRVERMLFDAVKNDLMPLFGELYRDLEAEFESQLVECVSEFPAASELSRTDTLRHNP